MSRVRTWLEYFLKYCDEQATQQDELHHDLEKDQSVAHINYSFIWIRLQFAQNFGANKRTHEWQWAQVERLHAYVNNPHSMVAKVCITVYQTRRDYQAAIANCKCDKGDADPKRSQLLVHEVKKVNLKFQDIDHAKYFENWGKALGPNLLSITHMDFQVLLDPRVQKGHPGCQNENCQHNYCAEKESLIWNLDIFAKQDTRAEAGWRSMIFVWSKTHSSQSSAGLNEKVNASRYEH